MSEFLRYNPANIKPEFFLTPPTSPLNDEFKYLATQVNQALLFSKRHKPRQLGIGAEFEVIFFSPDCDPSEWSRNNNWRSPNYFSEHKTKLAKLNDWSNEISSRPRFIPCESIGKLSIEYRTKKADLDGYISAVDELKDEIQWVSHTLNVCPVVYSQHLHISLLTAGGRNLTTERKIWQEHIRFIRKTFRDVRPLVFLPEDITSGFNPIQDKGIGVRGSRQRAEFRALSSEYACNPFLNVLLSLYSLHLAQNCKKDECVDNRLLGSDYSVAVLDMAKNEAVQKLFGQETLSDLIKIVSYYPDVSKRKLTVGDLIKNWKTLQPSCEKANQTKKQTLFDRLVSLVRHS